MKIFENSYFYVLKLARHHLAHYYLMTLSFLESFILPFPPPDVMLAPMSIAQPKKALRFAFLTTLASILGGIVGYMIGSFAFDFIQPYIVQWGYESVLEKSMFWFKEWGFWAVLIAGFSPIPYKIFTISAGLMALSFFPFLTASFIGRGLRFYLVAYFLAKFGQSFEPLLIKYIERIGWAVVALFLLIILYAKFLN